MKRIVLICGLLFAQSLLFAQLDKRTYVWRVKFAGCQYEFPRTWEYDPFGSFDPQKWNSHGSAVCECTGVVHIDHDEELFFVMYPSLPEELESDPHMRIWDYRYVKPESSQSFEAKKTRFQSERSYLQHTEKDQRQEAWRYTTELGDYAYVFYFFSKKKGVLEANESVIRDILNSVKRSRKFSFEMTEEVKR